MIFMRKVDNRHTIIGGRHRALSRWYMIRNRTTNTDTAKNKCYRNIEFALPKDEFVEWFMANDFKGCSVDRIDNTKGYTMDNIQLLTLKENIIKDKPKTVVDNKTCCTRCGKWVNLTECSKDKRRPTGYASICKLCDNARCRANYAKHHVDNSEPVSLGVELGGVIIDEVLPENDPDFKGIIMRSKE